MKNPVVLLLFLVVVYSRAFSPRGIIVSRQRASPTFLSAKRVQKAPARHADKWQPYFDRLNAYKDKHGDCNVTEGDLGEWLHEQRRQYHLLKQGKKVRLTKKRAMALERAGAIVEDKNVSP